MKGAISLLLVSRILFVGWALSGTTAPLVAATFTVNTQLDSHDTGGICAKASGKCSLRSAIEESNAHPEFPAEIIIVPRGLYKLTLGQLEIKSSLFLRGSGPTLTIIDGNRRSRIFMISPKSGGTAANPTIVNISGVTIQNGYGGIENGAGIYVQPLTSVSLDNSRVIDNKSSVGGVGILNAGIFDLSRSTVRGNVILGGGGGVTGIGAGIANIRFQGQTTQSYLTITGSTVSDNTGIRGGGIYNGRDSFTDITNSTISGNKASLGGRY